MSQPVVVLGDALIDEIRDSAGSREFVGGAGLNVAVGLALLGVPTVLIAMVGDDDDGATIRAFLDGHGVALLATRAPHGSARATSDRTEGGEPTYVFNDAARGRVLELGDAERAVLDAAPLVVASCWPFDVPSQAALLEAVRDAATRLVIDPNPRPGLMHDLGAFADAALRVGGGARLVKIGDDDAALLWGAGLRAAAKRFLAQGAGAVLATAGRAGAELHTAEGDVVGAPITAMPGPVVDTMGGGDATLASVTASLLSEEPAGADAWAAVLDRAMAIAAATVRHEGALLRRP